MRIISWNVRVAGRKGFISQIKEIIRIYKPYKPDIITLLETKVNSSRATKIIKKLNFNHYKEISPIGLMGGIWWL